MAKSSQFIAFDLRRKNRHQLASPPEKITTSKMRKDAWTATKSNGSTTKVTKGKKTSKIQKTTKTAKSAGGILKCQDEFAQCLHCDRLADDSACGMKCYRDFAKDNFLTPSKIDIRGPNGHLGYAAFLSPNSKSIPKNTYIGEYIGELHPPGHLSLYGIEIPNTCVIDAERAGNWTRFVNSSCRPNVRVSGDFVGKRHVVLFETMREVKAGEELTWKYGKKYFEQAGFLCRCDAVQGEHLPGAKGKVK